MYCRLGTQISVYGSVGPAGFGATPLSSYSVDGGPEKIFSATQAGTGFDHRLFFQSPPLPLGQHTLSITNLVDDDFFSLDYFIVNPSSSPITSPSQTSSYTTSFSKLHQSDTIYASTAPPWSPIPSTADSSAPGSSKSSSASMTGKIVGGLFGGLGFLGIVLVFMYLIHLRKRRERRKPASAVFIDPSMRMSLDK